MIYHPNQCVLLVEIPRTSSQFTFWFYEDDVHTKKYDIYVSQVQRFNICVPCGRPCINGPSMTCKGTCSDARAWESASPPILSLGVEKYLRQRIVKMGIISCRDANKKYLIWNHHPTFPEWVSITQPGETRDGKTSLRTHRSLLSVTLNELVNTVDEPGNRIIWSWHRKMLLGQLLLIAASSCHMGAQARSGDARWMCPHAKHPGDHECKRQLFPEWKSLSSRKEDMVQCFCSHYISFNDDSRPPWFLYLAHF